MDTWPWWLRALVSVFNTAQLLRCKNGQHSSGGTYAALICSIHKCWTLMTLPAEFKVHGSQQWDEKHVYLYLTQDCAYFGQFWDGDPWVGVGACSLHFGQLYCSDIYLATLGGQTFDKQRTLAIRRSYTCNVFLFLLSFLFEVLQFPNGVCGGYCYPRNLG